MSGSTNSPEKEIMWGKPMSSSETSAPRQHAPTGTALPRLPEPSHAERIRTLLSLTSIATLSTISRKHTGFPFGSLMPFALDAAGRPILLISSMAIDSEPAIPAMVDRLWMFLCRIAPSLDDFQDEQIELADETARPSQTQVACLNRRGTFPHGGQSLPMNGPVAPT